MMSTNVVLQQILDLIQVSRPGWWLVTVWLYLAPSGGSSAGSMSTMSNFDWIGLLFCCLPLNALLYSLNDVADRTADMSNPRKGNWIFGPKGWDASRIHRCIGWSSLCTLGLLFLWAYDESIHQQEQTDAGMTLVGLILRNVLWFAAGVVINLIYNSGVVRPPWEIILAYLGYGMVSILSFWRHQATTVTSEDGAADDTRSYAILWNSSDDGTLYFAGCNVGYWIHLAFLILRTQLWTEYMDYEYDAEVEDRQRREQHKTKTTTLSHCCQSKGQARLVVLATLLMEVAWMTYRAWFCSASWRTLWMFSCMGLVLFLQMEYLSFKGSRDAEGNLDVSSLKQVALMQTTGGIYLLYDCWKRGVFVE